MKLVWIVSLMVITMVTSASADVITQWNFNGITPGNISTATPSTGIGSASLVGGVTTPATGSSGVGSSDPAATNLALQTTTFAAQGTGDLTRGVQFLASTVGWNGISISYDLRHSNTSSRYEQVQYTLDGGSNWVNAQVFDGNAGDTWFNNRTVDLTGVVGANDNASFGLRVVATFAPSTAAYAASNSTSNYAATGTWRFDMVTISGATAVPEPTSLALLGLVGGVGLMARARSRKVKS